MYDSQLYDGALRAITAAYKIDPNNEDVKREYTTIKDGVDKVKADERKKFSHLFK